MKFWKPFERWTEVKGDRTEHQIHADFALNENEFLELWIREEGGVNKPRLHERPPPGKIYKVHLHLALEVMNNDAPETA